MGLVRHFPNRRMSLIRSVYPIRTTTTDYLYIGESMIIRHDHPGYVLEGNEEAYRQPLETDEVDHEYYAVHRELREDFAKRMREAKICVFDASLERKLIRKVF
jgi:predicted oxidoreductase